MKKLMAIILTLALVLTFTACNNDSGSGNTGGGNRDRGNTGGENSSSSAGVGDIIKFGELEWRVLEVQDGMALVISEYLLEYQQYHADYDDATWEHSSLRAYLNGEFYNSFSSAEQGRILETTVINNDNPEYGTPGGNNTTDNIFLLSIDEAQTYFTDDSSRIAYFADGDVHFWWLRSPGYLSDYAANVNGDGYVIVDGIEVERGFVGVRPALWLNL
ncbi:MAG: DUF6273 domain-containing protein [Oscillospiraceae bacterium]|jgi:hypothetical protein|nr:DUF6273 domain-containing protein [Oscillospiraceae bacterium]